MSLIHKALQQSASETAQARSSSFNPLSGTAKPNNKQLTLSLISVLLVVAIVVVILWPTHSTDETTPATVLAGTDTPIEDPIEVATTPELESIETASTEDLDDTPIFEEALSEETAQIFNSQIDDLTNVQQPSQQTTVTTEDSIQQIAVESQTAEPVHVQRTTTAVQPAQAQVSQTVPAIKSATSSPIVNENSVSVSRPVAAIASRADSASELTSEQSIVKTSESIWSSQVERHLENGEVEQAEVKLKQWIGAAANDPQPRIWLARIYINNGAEKSAEPLLVGQTSAEALGLLGIVYERTARPQQAATVFEGLYRSQPSNGKWLLFWAINAERSGELAKSGQLYQTYLNLFSFDDQALSRFAEQRLAAVGGS